MILRIFLGYFNLLSNGSPSFQHFSDSQLKFLNYKLKGNKENLLFQVNLTN